MMRNNKILMPVIGLIFIFAISLTFEYKNTTNDIALNNIIMLAKASGELEPITSICSGGCIESNYSDACFFCAPRPNCPMPKFGNKHHGYRANC